MRKILFLFFALLLPVLIFLFLKSFGKNEFEVPVLFADSVTAPVDCKAYRYKSPYTITDSVLQKISWNEHDSITVIVFEDRSKTNQHERQIHIMRIFEQFKTERLKIVQLYTEPLREDDSNPRYIRRQLREESFYLLRNCVFLLSPDNDAVIIDGHKRIRGQYNLAKREEADRMIMQEMNILFKRY